VRTTERELAKQHQTSFILIWSSIIVKKVRDIFHFNFKEGMKDQPNGYRVVNLGETTNAQNQAQQQASAQMQQIKAHLWHPCNTLG
jgi:hypothetical protein